MPVSGGSTSAASLIANSIAVNSDQPNVQEKKLLEELVSVNQGCKLLKEKYAGCEISSLPKVDKKNLVSSLDGNLYKVKECLMLVTNYKNLAGESSNRKEGWGKAEISSLTQEIESNFKGLTEMREKYFPKHLFEAHVLKVVEKLLSVGERCVDLIKESNKSALSNSEKEKFVIVSKAILDEVSNGLKSVATTKDNARYSDYKGKYPLLAYLDETVGKLTIEANKVEKQSTKFQADLQSGQSVTKSA